MRRTEDMIATSQRAGVVYEVPCEDCHQSSIGESGHSLEVRLAEHQRHVRQGETARSAIAAGSQDGLGICASY